MFNVKNFEYNGFYGRELPGLVPYKAEFVRWTNDPGVAEFSCSDGKSRLIPSFAIEGDSSLLPPQDYKKLGGKILFGLPSHS